MVVCGGVAAVYSRLMPKKTAELRRFLSEQDVVPAETYRLGDYNPDDSPEDVGLFISGPFYPLVTILGDPRSFVSLLRKEKERELEAAASTNS